MLELKRSMYSVLLDSTFLVFALFIFCIMPLRLFGGIVYTISIGEFTFFEVILLAMAVFITVTILSGIILYSNVFSFGVKVEEDRLIIKKFMRKEVVPVNDIRRIVYNKYFNSYRNSYTLMYGRKSIILDFMRFTNVEKFVNELGSRYNINIEIPKNNMPKWF